MVLNKYLKTNYFEIPGFSSTNKWLSDRNENKNNE